MATYLMIFLWKTHGSPQIRLYLEKIQSSSIWQLKKIFMKALMTRFCFWFFF